MKMEIESDTKGKERERMKANKDSDGTNKYR